MIVVDASCLCEVGLAESLDAPLLPLDRRLAQVRGLRCQVEVVG